MSGKILQFGKNMKSTPEKPSVQQHMSVPREYPNAHILEAVKY